MTKSLQLQKSMQRFDAGTATAAVAPNTFQMEIFFFWQYYNQNIVFIINYQETASLFRDEPIKNQMVEFTIFSFISLKNRV